MSLSNFKIFSIYVPEAKKIKGFFALKSKYPNHSKWHAAAKDFTGSFTATNTYRTAGCSCNKAAIR